MRVRSPCAANIVWIVSITACVWLQYSFVHTLKHFEQHHEKQKLFESNAEHDSIPNNRTYELLLQTNADVSIKQKRSILTVQDSAPVHTKDFRQVQPSRKHEHTELHPHSQMIKNNKNSTSPTNRRKRKADPQMPYSRNAAQMPYSRNGPLPETFNRGLHARTQFNRPSFHVPAILSRRDHISPFEGERVGERRVGQSALRQRLLDALARRIQERNMIMHDPGLLRERAMLDSPELFGRPSSEDSLLRPRSPLLLDQERMHPYPLESRLNEPRYAIPFAERLSTIHRPHPILDPSLLSGVLSNEEASILPSRRMFTANVGNLGDETLPYGSLGESKAPEYIPVGRVGSLQNEDSMFTQPNQDMQNEELTEFVPAIRPLRKQKKTWVTDVNVYSKKKKDDDVNSLLNDDDNDPLDEFVRNRCHPNPCMHGSKCTETNTGFQCSCAVGFKGRRCRARNFCLPNPCMNDAVCTESSSTDGFSCACRESWYGKICDQKRTACTPSPCRNHGHCFTDGTDAFECVCQTGTSGKLCEEGKLEDPSLQSIAHMFHVGEKDTAAVQKSAISTPPSSATSRPFACEANPCRNGGICRTDVTSPRGYQCQCSEDYNGVICEEKKCQCQNGGTCIGEGVEVKCICRPGYGGRTCQEHTQCNEDTCLHGGICIEEVGGFHCKCDNGYKGQRCEEYDKCRPNPCLHGGKCKDYGDFYKCECKRGFKGKQCEDLDLCQPNPCHNGGQCFGYPGGFQCECLPGYSGKACDDRIHCLSNPCSNGAECIEVPATSEKPEGTYKCGCKGGFMGESCEEKDFCHSSPCHNSGSCVNTKDGFLCSCLERNYGKQCEHINHCYGTPCKNNGKCISSIHDFKCECNVGFKGPTCQDVDYCQPNPCKNNGYCTSNPAGNGFICQCTEGHRGLTCSDLDPCYPNPCTHGDCKEIAGGYICNCTTGFKGPKCSEINRCEPNPCFHGGTCEQINGGVGYVCQCQPGYKGEMCERKDLCHPNPCHHNGECSDGLPPAFSEHNKYSVQANKRQLGAIHCTCAKGFKGERCDEIDPCYPNPCEHDSTCIANAHAPIKCNCSIGWKGEHCAAVDLCSPDPCRYGTHCIQTDEESYQCVKNLCAPNPCSNGGKCIVVNDEGYECACLRGWRGKNCESQDICVPNPCINGGVCHVMEDGSYTCECPTHFAGNKCQIQEKVEKEKDLCAAYPCKNGGTCIGTEGGFTCRCNNGFSGPFCEDSVCHPNPCENAGTCVPYYGIALCKCAQDYTGAHCSELKKPRTVQHSDIDKAKTLTVDTNGVAKSLTPHVTEILQHSGANSPLLVERVEEILNSDKDESQSSNSKKKTGLPQQMVAAPVAKLPAQPTTKQELHHQPSAPQPPSSQPKVPSRPPSLPPSKTQSAPSSSPPSQPPTSHVAYPSMVQKPQLPTLEEIATPNGPIYRAVVVINTKDPCQPNICLHGGICVVRSNGEPECICPDGFSGPLCKQIGVLGYSSAPKFFPHDECKHCDKNSICVNGHCICQQNYVGDGLECTRKTQTDVDWKCDPSPCQNGGTCKPGRAKCVCRLGYIGTFCENYCPPVVHLSFDTMKGNYVKDESGNNNNAVMKNGAEIIYEGGKCDSAASLLGGDILLDGANFSPKPRDSITMAVWVKLETNRGIQSVFDTVGGAMSNHREGQYHLEIDNGRIRWFHRNERRVTIFSVLSEPLITEGNWTHITGTYSGLQREAKLFVNGDLVGTDSNTSSTIYLSQDWEVKAGIGKHEHKFGNRLLRGMVDEFFIFACSLPRLEILVLMHHCKIYWKKDPHNKSPSSKHEVTGVTNAASLLVKETSSAQKDPGRFQNYMGYTSKEKPQRVVTEPGQALAFTNKPVAEQVTVPGSQRYRIARPPQGNQWLLPARNQVPSRHINEDPRVLYGEVREFLNHDRYFNGDKRTGVLQPNEIEDLEKKLNIKLKPYVRARFHHAPVIRNENKELPFGPHAYLNYPKTQFGGQPMLPSVAKSTFPGPPIPPLALFKHGSVPSFREKVHKAVKVSGPSAFLVDQNIGFKKSPVPKFVPQGPFPNPNANPYHRNPAAADPRWFTWTKGLASTAGGTHSNTHSNTLQRNDPGTANADTHVQSSQNAGGKTNVKQMYNLPAQYSTLYQNQFPQNAPAQTKQVHTENHNHQWGFGNGNGNGNGVGTPGGSGSGGGWGSGGPLSQKINLPGWDGNPPDGPPWGDKAEEARAKQQQQQQQQQQQKSFVAINNPPAAVPTFPANARELWNRYIAQKKQSTSEMHTDATNIASSGVKINPANGQHVGVQNHQWGYGNGNGDANGHGEGGGTGDAGGWGAGGPVKQNTWLPGQQQQPKNFIHSPSLQSALGQSLKVPWLPKGGSNQEKQQASISYSTPPSVNEYDRRSQITSLQSLPPQASAPTPTFLDTRGSITGATRQDTTNLQNAGQYYYQSNVAGGQQQGDAGAQITKSKSTAYDLNTKVLYPKENVQRIGYNSPNNQGLNVQQNPKSFIPSELNYPVAKNNEMGKLVPRTQIPNAGLPQKYNQYFSTTKKEESQIPSLSLTQLQPIRDIKAQAVEPVRTIQAQVAPAVQNAHFIRNKKAKVELSEAERREIISQAITDAMNGLKKKKKKKKKKRSMKEKRSV
ncbi:uncharacterized protein LOC130647358 isoform X2 [Hydractinia symbiolongicarpus]|uniref:uncharacterized protein LOC130647358 isoform X2 n=1 Tax=Hydractinia symbiolongicarpus TaxID=13093 RepID=UPI00254E686A|nr:uncharacterized protein LOC130647358 isoform X2 [Hydractinia symbiolongicarpus]